MGNKIITEKDFWMCTGGNMPAPFQSTQLSTKKQSGEKYITKIDTSTSSIIDFGCKKAMLIMAIVAAIIAVAILATGGAALLVIGFAAGAVGAAVGAVAGGMICGQIAAVGREWINSKSNMKIQGQEAITGDSIIECHIFGDKITYAPQIKNWWQAIAVGSVNTGTEILKGALSGAMTGMGIGLLGGSIKLALPTLSSIGGNVAASFGIVGSSVRTVFGVQNATNQWVKGKIETMTDAAVAFKDGALPEAGSIYRICTGQAQGQDAMLALYLLNVRFPNKTSNRKSSSNKNEKSIKNTSQKPNNKASSSKKKTGEAYESIKAKKKAQLKKNKKDGLQREVEVKQELTNEGHEVLNSQVSVKTKYTRRIIDHLIKEKGTGKVKAIEVKNGGATRNKTQVLKDNSMANDGGTIIGENAPKNLKEQTIKIETEVRN